MSSRPLTARCARLAALLAAGAVLCAPAALGADAPKAPAGGPARPAVGDQLVTFSAPDLDGKQVDVASLLKGKPALVTFWASWCQPCMSEIPKLRMTYAEFRAHDLVVLGIGLHQGGDTADKERLTAIRQRIDYPLVHDAEDKYQKAYDLTSLPLNILVDRSGAVTWVGPILPTDLDERIAGLLVEKRAKETHTE